MSIILQMGDPLLGDSQMSICTTTGRILTGGYANGQNAIDMATTAVGLRPVFYKTDHAHSHKINGVELPRPVTGYRKASA